MNNNESLMEFQGGDATIAALILAQQLGIKPIVDDLSKHSRSNPDPASFEEEGKVRGTISKGKMNNAFVDLTKEVNPDFDPAKQMLQASIGPDYPNYPGAMARNSKVDPETYTIKTNDGIDRVVYAHELGHVLGQNTPIARQVNDLRRLLQYNPKLSDMIEKGMEILPENTPEGLRKSIRNSLQPSSLYRGARYLAPALAAGMIEGDEDLATSLAITAAMTAPAVIDEGIASANAMKIMDKAGMPATGLQKRRMAAALGQYIAPALVAGLGGNVVGNLLD